MFEQVPFQLAFFILFHNLWQRNRARSTVLTLIWFSLLRSHWRINLRHLQCFYHRISVISTSPVCLCRAQSFDLKFILLRCKVLPLLPPLWADYSYLRYLILTLWLRIRIQDSINYCSLFWERVLWAIIRTTRLDVWAFTVSLVNQSVSANDHDVR